MLNCFTFLFSGFLNFHMKNLTSTAKNILNEHDDEVVSFKILLLND